LGLKARIAVAGAGSIGCYAGGCLSLAGRRVIFLTRPALAGDIARHGLCISPRGVDRRLAPDGHQSERRSGDALRAGRRHSRHGQERGDAGHGGSHRAHRSAGAIVVSLQNGVANVDRLNERWAIGVVVAGMVPFNVVQTRDADGCPALPSRHERHASGGAAFPALRALLDVPGPGGEHADMPAVQWGKLLFNLNNALNALSGLPLATQLADRNWRLLLEEAIEEALAVFRADRIQSGAHRERIAATDPFHSASAGWSVSLGRATHAGDRSAARSSDVGDLERRRATEIK
jgi:2-dehydropantoate 2-reductase